MYVCVYVYVSVSMYINIEIIINTYIINKLYNFEKKESSYSNLDLKFFKIKWLKVLFKIKDIEKKHSYIFFYLCFWNKGN
jgi:hypothetical protein